VTFLDTTNMSSPVVLQGCSNLSVGLLSTSDPTVGSVGCTTSLGIGNSGATVYNIGIRVEGHYARAASTDTTVTVALPSPGMITGGGFLVGKTATGRYATDVGAKNNFGFNVKYNKAQTSLQGNINTIVRRTDAAGVLRTYQVKGNSLTSLSTTVTSVGGTAVFTGKASIQDVTDPLNVVSLGGNATLRATLADNGNPGSTDTIGFTVHDGSGALWYTSSWNTTLNRTGEQSLGAGNGGGNLVVR
jgi:hypothetical protein